MSGAPITPPSSLVMTTTDERGLWTMTISLAAVFLPVFFMGGILGRLLHEFAVVIISAILVSGVVSLSAPPS